MKLGNSTLEKTAALAPMAGVADRAFRQLCREYGACYTVGEMTSAKALEQHNKKSAALLEIGELERPCAVQLFGSEPETVAFGVEQALLVRPDAIDLNMGCPVPKAAGQGVGAAMMKQPERAAEVTAAAVGAAAGRVPITVKFRTGWDENSINAVEFARLQEQAGASAITVHGRTRQQFYAPPIDFETLAAVVKAVHIPVICNGGCETPADVAHMYHVTGCDLVMVGQGALGRPWIFDQIRAFLTAGELLPEPDFSERMAVFLRHMELACQYKGEKLGMREGRKHAAWYLKGFRGAASLRGRCGALSTFEDARDLVKSALEMVR